MPTALAVKKGTSSEFEFEEESLRIKAAMPSLEGLEQLGRRVDLLPGFTNWARSFELESVSVFSVRLWRKKRGPESSRGFQQIVEDSRVLPLSPSQAIAAVVQILPNIGKGDNPIETFLFFVGENADGQQTFIQVFSPSGNRSSKMKIIIKILDFKLQWRKRMVFVARKKT